jgi:hypothetical protein
VLARLHCAQVRLERHVPEILQRQQAEVFGVVQDAGHRYRHRREQ